MEYQQLLYDVSDHVATITLNRPDRLNAYTKTMELELRAALIRSEKDDGVRVSILTGAGRGFCAGMDMEDSSGDTTSHEKMKIPQEDKDWYDMSVLKFAFSLKKPVIVAINGAAVGVGVTITLPFDIRIAAESAKMGIVFTRRGIVPEIGSPWLLPRIIGLSKATELMYTGRTIKAKEALEFGLVSRVLPDDELMKTARELADEIATYSSPVNVALTKSMIYQFLFAKDLDQVDRINKEYLGWGFGQPDAVEGILSFLEKRPPDWKMKVSQDLPDFFPMK